MNSVPSTTVVTTVWRHTVVTTVVEGTEFIEFQTSVRQTGFVAVGTLSFRAIALELIFPLTVSGQLIVDA